MQETGKKIIDSLVNPMEPPEPPASRGDSIIERINLMFPGVGDDELPDPGPHITDDDAMAE